MTLTRTPLGTIDFGQVESGQTAQQSLELIPAVQTTINSITYPSGYSGEFNPPIVGRRPTLDVFNNPTWDAGKQALSAGSPAGAVTYYPVDSSVNNTTITGRIELTTNTSSNTIFIASDDAFQSYIIIRPQADGTNRIKVDLRVSGVFVASFTSVYNYSLGVPFWCEVEIDDDILTVSFGATRGTLSPDANITAQNISAHSAAYTNVYKVNFSASLNGYMYVAEFEKPTGSKVFEFGYNSIHDYFVNLVEIPQDVITASHTLDLTLTPVEGTENYDGNVDVNYTETGGGAENLLIPVTGQGVFVPKIPTLTTYDYLTPSPVRWDWISYNFYGSFDYVEQLIEANKHIPFYFRKALFIPIGTTMIIPTLEEIQAGLSTEETASPSVENFPDFVS